MNDQKSRQGEGYDLYDYDELAFLAAGNPELIYVVGTNQNAAIQGAWPNEAGWTGPLITVNALAGQPNVTVADTTGFVAGQMVILIDPVTNLSEIAFVAVITPTVAPAGVLTMLANLVNPYLVANAAIVHPYLPVDAQNTLFYADVACNIRLVSRALFSQQVLGVLPALPAVPGQITIPATTWISLPDKWFILYAVAVGAVAGTLIIKASG